MQIKIPAKYVSAIIGKGGTVVKNIQELTNTYIKMEKENFSSERVCYIRSDDIENIYSAQNMIQNIINNLPIIETFELFVPFEASKKVFKRNLNTISFVQEIQKSYGAKVIVENNAHKTASTYIIYIQVRINSIIYHVTVMTKLILYSWIKEKDYIKRNR